MAITKEVAPPNIKIVTEEVLLEENITPKTKESASLFLPVVIGLISVVVLF